MNKDRISKMKPWIWSWVLIITTAAFTANPNFVIIYTDDQGYGDLSSYGATRLATPNIDRMAQEGIKMTDFYSGYPICTPSRAALMTGMYPERLQLGHNMHTHLNDVIFPPDQFGLNPNEVTLADLFKANGYVTAMMGKWHLGHQPKFLPTRQGFDSYYGIPYSNDMLPTRLMYMEDDVDTLGLSSWNPRYHSDQGYLTEWYTDSAITFIDRNRDTTFFLYIAPAMPHVPLFASPAFQGHNQNNWTYGDVIEEIDFHVGRILDTLKSWGLDTNTLVMYSSDNGASVRTSNQPLRGGKQDNLEGGMRVPGIFWWPTHINAGQTSGQMASVLDVYPTFAAIAGFGLPRNRPFDGEDITDILMGVPGAAKSIPFYYELSAIRVGDFKLLKDQRIRNQYTNNVNELYNVSVDVDESNDLSGQNAALRDSLLTQLNSFVSDLNSNIRTRGSATSPILKHGCMDPTAQNYDQTAGVDNGTCDYQVSVQNKAIPKIQFGKNGIKLYEGNSSTLYIHDVNGKIVGSIVLDSTEFVNLKEFLKSGIYFLRVGNNPSVKWLNI